MKKEASADESYFQEMLKVGSDIPRECINRCAGDERAEKRTGGRSSNSRESPRTTTCTCGGRTALHGKLSTAFKVH